MNSQTDNIENTHTPIQDLYNIRRSPSQNSQFSSISPPRSPPPPAIRIHNPHTILPSQHEYTALESFRSDNPNDRDNDVKYNMNEKWTPLPPSEPMPYSPFHIDQLQNEKNLTLTDHPPSASTPSTFHRIQPSIAPQLSSLSQPTRLYHPPTNSSTSQNSVPRRENAIDSQSHGQNQRHDHHQPHNLNIDGNSKSGVSSLNEAISRKQRENNNNNNNNSSNSNSNRGKRNSGTSPRRERTSGSTIATPWEEGKATSSSIHSNTSHNRPNASSIKSGTTVNEIDNPIAREPTSLPPSQNRFSVLRRKLNSSRHRNTQIQGISWEDRQHTRRTKTHNIPLGRGGVQDVGGYRKTGIPGRNGEEPETNLFNFINIILNIPNDLKLKQAVSKLLKILAFITTSYFLLMALYFSAEYRSFNYLQNISILVVDLDRSMIGNHFLNFTQQDQVDKNQVNWSVQYKYKDIDSIVEEVSNGNYWGAMVVRANASAMLNKALSTPLPDYDPTKAFLFVYDSGRNPLVVKPYVIASMYTQFLQFTKFFNPAWITFVLSFADTYNATLTPLTAAPQVLGIPIAFEELDIHPLNGNIITSATSVAYIWIFLIAGASTYLVAHVVQPITRFSSVKRTMAFLVIPLLGFLCSLSMTYTVLLRIFGVSFDSTGKFMALFSAMLLLQSAVASLVLFLIYLIPVTFIPMITITFVVMNVIAVFNPVELMPGFFLWVYAMPFLNAVQLARYILMGSYNRLNYNIPILFAWILVPITLLPFAIARQKRLMAEVLELELQERRLNHQSGYPLDKVFGFSQYMDEDVQPRSIVHDDDNMTKRVNRSAEYERQRPSRSRRYDNEKHNDSDSYQSGGEDSDENRHRQTRDRRRRRRHHRREPKGSDEYTDTDDGSYNDGGHRTAVNTARLIRPLNPRSVSTGVEPSAPPESHVFDTHGQSLAEMLNLSRHPYASELFRPHSPDEVKE